MAEKTYTFKSFKGKTVHFEPMPIVFIEETYTTTCEKEAEALRKALDVVEYAQEAVQEEEPKRKPGRPPKQEQDDVV